MVEGDEERKKPDWWVKNERTREELDLPEYTPPRFEDDVFTHEVVPELEGRFGCDIQFVGLDPRYPEDWYVRIDGESKFQIGRRRDETGSTVHQMSSDRFRENVVEARRETD